MACSYWVSSNSQRTVRSPPRCGDSTSLASMRLQFCGRFFHRIFPAWHIAIEQINVMPWCAGELDHLCSLRPNDKTICLILGYQESRSEEHTSELQSLMRISSAVFCLNNKKNS